MANGEVFVSAALGPRITYQQEHMKPTRLYCMNGGHHLHILPDGTVGGTRDENDVHSKIVWRLCALCTTVHNHISCISKTCRLNASGGGAVEEVRRPIPIHFYFNRL